MRLWNHRHHCKVVEFKSAQEWLTSFFCLGSISTADGSALVKLGNTTVICGIKAVKYFTLYLISFLNLKVRVSDRLCSCTCRSWPTQRWSYQGKVTLVRQCLMQKQLVCEGSKECSGQHLWCLFSIAKCPMWTCLHSVPPASGPAHLVNRHRLPVSLLLMSSKGARFYLFALLKGMCSPPCPSTFMSCVLQLWIDPNRGLMHREGKGNTHVH